VLFIFILCLEGARFVAFLPSLYNKYNNFPGALLSEWYENEVFWI